MARTSLREVLVVFRNERIMSPAILPFKCTIDLSEPPLKTEENLCYGYINLHNLSNSAITLDSDKPFAKLLIFEVRSDTGEFIREMQYDDGRRSSFRLLPYRYQIEPHGKLSLGLPLSITVPVELRHSERYSVTAIFQYQDTRIVSEPVEIQL